MSADKTKFYQCEDQAKTKCPTGKECTSPEVCGSAKGILKDKGVEETVK